MSAQDQQIEHVLKSVNDAMTALHFTAVLCGDHPEVPAMPAPLQPPSDEVKSVFSDFAAQGLAAALLKRNEIRRCEVTQSALEAMRMATPEPASLLNGKWHLSYFEAAFAIVDQTLRKIDAALAPKTKGAGFLHADGSRRAYPPPALSGLQSVDTVKVKVSEILDFAMISDMLKSFSNGSVENSEKSTAQLCKECQRATNKPVYWTALPTLISLISCEVAPGIAIEKILQSFRNGNDQVVKLLRDGLSIDQVTSLTGKSADSVRTTKSRAKAKGAFKT